MSHSKTYHLSTGQARPVYGARKQRIDGIRKQMVADAHTLAVQATDGMTGKNSPEQWWAKDLRRGQRSVYGGIFRFILLLYRRGFPIEQALELSERIRSFTYAVWDGAPESHEIMIALVTTSEHEIAA